MLGTSDGVADTGPDALVGKVQTVDGHAVASNMHASRHSQGGPPYWPFLLELSAPGLYELTVTAGSHTLTTAFTISPARGRAHVEGR